MAFLSAAFARAGKPLAAWGVPVAWVLGSALGLLPGSGLAAQAARPSEYQVKAVFLFNFAQFVDWPPEAIADSQAPFVIGILGGDPFGDLLDATVRGEHRGRQSFVVRRYQRIEDVKTCDILFISRPDADRLQGVLTDLKDRPILTVSDADGFAEHGGMIGFVTDRNRIRVKINLAVAQSAHLTISSKLLRVAEIINPPGP
ncbi:MAG TPA: YfiR family protein [Gemmatimonadales bacterium]|nr:YfiR family protein [Gemmatimonadales bacterium]